MRRIVMIAALVATACGGGGAKKDTAPPASTRAPADASLKPAGAGWFCTTPTSGPRVAFAGGCFRDEQACNDTIAEPFEDGTVYGPCTAQPTAFCHTQFFGPSNMNEFACSPTKDRCDHVADDWASPDSDYRDVSTCAEWD